MKKIIFGFGFVLSLFTMASVSAHDNNDYDDYRYYQPYYGNAYTGNYNYSQPYNNDSHNYTASYYQPGVSCGTNLSDWYREERTRYYNCKRYHKKYDYCDYYDSLSYTNPYAAWYYQ